MIGKASRPGRQAKRKLQLFLFVAKIVLLSRLVNILQNKKIQFLASFPFTPRQAFTKA
jgi:hypothetical protein